MSSWLAKINQYWGWSIGFEGGSKKIYIKGHDYQIVVKA
jgi:hypothetical protein